MESKLKLWLAAVELQKTRVEQKGSTSQHLDAHFFAIALRNLLRAVDMAATYCPEVVKTGLSRFNEAVPSAKNIRDVLEHFDDYDIGKGKLQRAGMEMALGAISLDIQGDRVIFAGDLHLSLETAAAEATALVDKVTTGLLSLS